MSTFSKILQEDLSDQNFQLRLGNEVQNYQLKDRKGVGQQGITYRGLDHIGLECAIKFVPKTEYASHSIQAEISKVKSLTNRFAQIKSYGTPKFKSSRLTKLFKDSYAIVVEWVNGDTLEDFLNIHGEDLDVPQFLDLANAQCEALALMNESKLSHNDLHGGNIMVTTERRGASLTKELHLTVIDTATLMTFDRRADLFDSWNDELNRYDAHSLDNAVVERRTELINQIKWFSRSDQEWVVSHLVNTVNCIRLHESKLPVSQRRYIQDVSATLSRMIDPDKSRRLDDPGEMYQELEMLWKSIQTPTTKALVTPFDLISAELIRSDEQFISLFSNQCPWYERCATTDPVYIYGPRGSGKSTILRRLSLPAVLASINAREQFLNHPYIGVYLSCSSELRSRFWLFPKESYPKIYADVILFFTMLLTEALLDTLELLRDGVIDPVLNRTVGLTNDTARKICGIVCAHFGLPDVADKLHGISWLLYAKKKLAIKRNQIWRGILTTPTQRTPDPSLLFDLCKELEDVFPLLREKHIAFLVDDYSNQRIPAELQRMLNQTISFAKQGNPIFKVTSEYQGVDLDGIQEGREVIEVNLGKEYVDLSGTNRSRFLEDVLNIRFTKSSARITAEQLLGRSMLSPGTQMARQIRNSAEPTGDKFYYHGVDTIADICSGDLAMALDLVKQIFVSVKDVKSLSSPVAPSLQHKIIHEYSDREHMYIRYYSFMGKQMSKIVDALCWLAHEAAVKCNSEKDGKVEPMIKTHLDISLQAVENLPAQWQPLLQEMQKKGVLFSLDTSKSRVANRGTERYQMRRILLVKHIAPLARRDPIKLDNDQSLVFLLSDPREFVNEELTRQKGFRF